jgi:hypothetical protein
MKLAWAPPGPAVALSHCGSSGSLGCELLTGAGGSVKVIMPRHRASFRTPRSPNVPGAADPDVHRQRSYMNIWTRRTVQMPEP